MLDGRSKTRDRRLRERRAKYVLERILLREIRCDLRRLMKWIKWTKKVVVLDDIRVLLAEEKLSSIVDSLGLSDIDVTLPRVSFIDDISRKIQDVKLYLRSYPDDDNARDMLNKYEAIIGEYISNNDYVVVRGGIDG